MVKYNCIKCNMDFNKKSNYIRHINKKFECSINNKINNKKNNEYSKKIQNRRFAQYRT